MDTNMTMGELGGTADRSLIAFAYLAQTARTDNDLLTGLAPIFRPLARGRVGQKFVPSEFAENVGKIFGLKVHPWAVEDLAPRLERAGLLQKVQLTQGSHEYAYAEVGDEFSDVSEVDIRLVVRRFVDFAKPLLEGHGLSESDDRLADAFLRHLVDMDFVAVLLRPDQSAANERKATTVVLKKPADQVQWEVNSSTQARFNVLCASFILDVHRNDRPLYELLVRIAAGALLSEVILNFQDPGAASNLSGLTVMLDAPFVMSLLDVSGEESHRFTADICVQLEERGAQLAMFRHSVDELRDNLRGVSGAVSSGRGYGPTARRMTSAPFKAYVTAVLADPDTAIRRAKISIMDVPTAAPVMQFCTGEDEERIRASLGFYESPLAQARDAQSVAGVLRLRRARRVRMGRLPACLYVFITQNPFVAERPNRYLRSHNMYADGEVPAAVTDRYLAGLLWVMFGGKSQDLPRQLLMANCAAAVEPRSDVIGQMHRFLSQVDQTQADHFRALMTEERAGQHLMQLTLGDSVFITQENAVAVLDQIKRVLIEEHEQRKKVEIAGLSKRHEEELAAQLAKTQAAAALALDAEASGLAAKAAATELNAKVSLLVGEATVREAAALKGLRLRAEACARRAGRRAKVLQVSLGVFIAISTVVVGHLLNEGLSVYARWSLWAAAAVLAFVSFWRLPDFFFGRMLNDFREGQFRKLWNDANVGEESVVVKVISWDDCAVSAARLPGEAIAVEQGVNVSSKE